MYLKGELEIKALITNLIANSTESYYNKSKDEFVFPYEVLQSDDKPIGYINMLCPECNKIVEHFSNFDRFDDLNIKADFYIKDIERVGTRMQLKRGRYGKFWRMYELSKL